MAADTFRLQLQIRAAEKGMAQASAGIRGHLKSLQSEVKRFNAQVSSLRAGAGQFATAARSLASPFRSLFGILSGVLGLARTVFSAFSGFVMGVVGAVTRLAGGVLGVARAIGSVLWGVAQRVFGGMLSLVQSVFGYMRTAAIVGVGALVGGLTMLARQGVKVNQSLLSVEKGLAVMLRSGTAAKELMADLRKEARTSTFEFVDLAGMTKRLLAFGFGKPEVLPMIRVLGDVAAGLEGGKDLLDRLILAFGQIRAKGKLMGQEAMQLMEAGIPVRELLKIRVGVDVGELAMPAAKAIPMLLAGLQQRFGGLQQQLAQTLPGRISNIRDEVNELSSAVTKGLFRSLTQAAGTVLQFLQNLNKTAAGQTILRTLSALFDVVGKAVVRAAAALPRIAEGIARFLASPGWAQFTAKATEVWGQFREGARDALGKALEWVMDLVSTGRLKTWGQFAWAMFKRIHKGMQDLVAWLKQNWRPIWNMMQTVVIGAVKVIGGGIMGVIAIVKNWIQIKGGLRRAIHAVIAAFVEFGVTGLKILQKAVMAVNTLIEVLIILKGVTLGATIAGPYGALAGLAAGLIGAAFYRRGIGAPAVRGVGEGIKWMEKQRREKPWERGLPAIPGLDTATGVFADAARQFGRDVDRFLDGLKPPAAVPKPPPAGMAPPKPTRGPSIQERATAWRQAFPGDPFPATWAREAEAAGIVGPPAFGPMAPVAPRPLESRRPIEVHVDVKLEGLPEGVDARVERVVTEWAYRAVGVPT